MAKIKTLTEFITDQQALNPGAKGDLSRLLNDIAIASKIVNREINKAGLVDILGEVGQENVQGESVKKLDIYANDQFIAAFKSGGECAAVASEENEDIVILDGLNSQNGKYLVSIDPLDGSSNIDVNISVGTHLFCFTKKRHKQNRNKRRIFCCRKRAK